MTNPTVAELAAGLSERARIVAWMRSQGAKWERLSRKSEKLGREWSRLTDSQANIAASYHDHADAIERGDHLSSQETTHAE